MDTPPRRSEFWDSILLPPPRAESSEDLSDLDSTSFDDPTDLGDNPDMPYNITPIAPRAEPTGSTQLPLSRVKKIIALDQDINMCSNNASFVITLATEMFIQYLAEQSHNVVKSERKPRRNIQYRDIANAVAHHDNLEFLGDVVPKTVKYGDVKESKNPASYAVNGSAKGSVVEAGQTTLDGSRKAANLINGASNGAGGQHNGSNDEKEQVKESRLPNGNASKSTPAVTEEDVEMS